ncbi:MAG: fatty acid--CoA ligase [Caulobacterales bacterium]|nr:fatty acid--CoA ligase [Caulobacterales bacterium]
MSAPSAPSTSHDTIADALTIADLARRQARSQPDKTAFTFEGAAVSFAEFDRGASQIANGLLAAGLKPGERVTYLGKNATAYFELLMGVSKAGGVTCPVNWRLAPPEIAYILNDARTRFLFVGPEFAGLIPALRSQVAALEHVLVTEGHGEHRNYADWRDSFSAADPAVPRAREDDALQLYTSGTTGRPKGAVLSNRATLTAFQRYKDTPRPEWNRWTAEDVSLVAMPCFHIGGTAWGLTGVAYGATGVIMREFDPSKVLDFMEEHRISKLFLVPAAMQIIVNQPRAREIDYSQLKYMIYGASPIPLGLLKQCMDVFQCGFVQMYGMTETAGTIVVLPPEDHDVAGNERMRSAGKPLPGIEIAVIDAQGRPLAPRHIGEIATRSDMNMSGYWNLPEASAQVLSGDGWLRTGDAGYLDEDGYVYIQDRVKDMIISGGENIYPAEVENAIYGHPSIADVAVIGVPDERWGEAVKACVVLRPGESVTEADVIAWARERIAGYKCPKSVDFIDALPRNPSGKILRRELRAPFWRDTGKTV